MNVKALRESKNLTQEMVADKLGVNRSTVAMWETGKAKPSADKIPMLARIFECTIDELFATE